MADHDELVSQDTDAGAVEETSHVELSHEHDFGLEYYHGLQMEQGHGGVDLDLDLGRGDEFDLSLERSCDDEVYVHESHLSVEKKLELIGSDFGLRNDELAVEKKSAFVVHENHNLDDNLSLFVAKSQDMTVIQTDDMRMDHHRLVVNESPVIQARMAVASTSYELAVGQEFPDVLSCRRALRDTAIALHFEIQTIKSDKTRYTAKCASKGCPWRIHAAKLPDVPTFTIRTIHEQHTCGGIAHLGHQQASAQWIASNVEHRLKENPNCKPKEILEEIHRTHGVTLSYKQAWRGKERIMTAMRCSFEEGYCLLPQYCEQLNQANPGSMASVYGDPLDNSFKRLFVSFHASIYGFINACRPLIGLDRTTLKSKYLGTLLFATGFDADGALFPLAFGVVDEENEDNWMWFLSELRNFLEVNTENMPRLTILSDRQKGIVEGVEANFPTAFHGFCMLHLIDSFQREFNSPMLVHLFWEAAQALTVNAFHAKMMEIENISQDASYWIQSVPVHLWATAYFRGKRFGQFTANIVESMNSLVLESSSLPMIQTLECIRRQLMTWFNQRGEASMHWSSTLVPSAERQVSEAIDRARTYQPLIRANETEYEIISHNGTNIVNIRNRECSCRGWEHYGLPCAHAVSALQLCKQDVQRYTGSFFTVASYRKTYSQTIHPIPDKSLWKESTLKDGSQVIKPPKSFRPPRKPRQKIVRAEDNGRAKRVVHCSRCNQTGHFRTTCAAPI